MNKAEFTYDKQDKEYRAVLNGIEIFIHADEFSDSLIAMAEKIVAVYPKKVETIAEMVAKDTPFDKTFTAKEIAEKLDLPVLMMDEQGGCLTYAEHTLDDVHVIDVEFGGILDQIYEVGIDG
ncbi:MAG: hypothetical protein LBU77_03390 [Clostridiales bacterium]|jgi:hypothetical protein|nr:hypothetical protein [Clostridiales bacterium]